MNKMNKIRETLLISRIPLAVPDLSHIIMEYDDDCERKLVNCKCCNRHNNGKPLGYNSLFLPTPTVMSEDEKKQDCECRCRQKLRNPDKCVIEVLYYIFPHETVNIIARYVN
jgi:hypothetical protein